MFACFSCCTRRLSLVFCLGGLYLAALALPAQGQSFVWARRFGVLDAQDDEAHGVASGPGGVYVVGFTTGAFAGQTSAGNKDAVVAKYSPGGDQLWLRQFGTSAEDVLEAVTTDATGVYVAGTTRGTLAGGGGGSADVIVRKYDPNGNELWTRQSARRLTMKARVSPLMGRVFMWWVRHKGHW